jgi:aspartyl-tRNA(Asn)/glutamyl-tRNA(Gln) amidotransferase subunit A
MDCAIVTEVLAGRDERDSTSSTEKVENYWKFLGKSHEKHNIAVVKEIVEAISDKDVLEAFNKTLDGFKKRGYKINEVSIPNEVLTSLFPTYFVISCAEATSNNANLDGIKFGPLSNGTTYEEVMSEARTKGFGELIKRRFVIGSFALMKENQNDLFLRAQKNRRRIVEIVNNILKDNNFIYLPAAPSIAPKINESSDRLSDEYLIADNHLVLGNFAGLPSITLPIGFKESMPFGANLMGRAFDEVGLFQVAYDLEQITGLANICAKGGKK